MDVTVETLRARVETIGMLWDAFCARGKDIELNLEDLRRELELEIHCRVRGVGPLAAFCEIGRVADTPDAEREQRSSKRKSGGDTR